jgi:hypothetical protein
MTERSITAKIDITDKLANAEIETARTGQATIIGLTILSFAAAAVFFALGNQMVGIAFASFSVLMSIRPFLTRHDRLRSGRRG